MNEHTTATLNPQQTLAAQNAALLTALGAMVQRNDQPGAAAMTPVNLSTWYGQAIAARHMLATIASRLAGIAAIHEMMHGEGETLSSLLQVASSTTAMNRALVACSPRLERVMVAA